MVMSVCSETLILKKNLISLMVTEVNISPFMLKAGIIIFREYPEIGVFPAISGV
jgi:hypothetical protein